MPLGNYQCRGADCPAPGPFSRLFPGPPPGEVPCPSCRGSAPRAFEGPRAVSMLKVDNGAMTLPVHHPDSLGRLIAAHVGGAPPEEG